MNPKQDDPRGTRYPVEQPPVLDGGQGESALLRAAVERQMRERLVAMGLPPEQVEYALEPIRSFHASEAEYDARRDNLRALTQEAQRLGLEP